MPNISILLSIFEPNVSDLKRTINSISSQSFKDFELILVKDDDNELTLQLLKNISNVIDNVVLIDNYINIGLVKSLNKALMISKGKYIARIDVGDWWHNNKLEEQYKEIVANDLVLIGTQVKIFGTNHHPFWGAHQGINHYSLKSTKLPENDKVIRAYILAGKNPFVHSSVMFKKIENIFYNEKALHTEDFELWCRYSFFGRMSNLTNEYTSYLFDIKGITGSKRYLMFVNATKVYTNYIKYLHKKDTKKSLPPQFIELPQKEMSYFEIKFSKYYSIAEYEKLNGNNYKYYILLLFSFLLKPKVILLFMYKLLINKYYKLNIN